MDHYRNPRVIRAVRRSRLSKVLLALIALLVVLSGFYGLVGPLTHAVGDATVGGITDAEKKAAALNTVRQSLLVGTAGLAAVIGLAITGGTYFLARRGQIAERYVKAVGLLAGDGVDERVGGIFALEHVIRDSPAETATVIQVLAAFVKRRRPLQESDDLPADRSHKCGVKRMDVDIQAALTVLARQNVPQGVQLDLSFVDLAQAVLANGRFVRADLSGACLARADLRGADLRRANLQGTCFRDAELSDCRMAGAITSDADFTES